MDLKKQVHIHVNVHNWTHEFVQVHVGVHLLS